MQHIAFGDPDYATPLTFGDLIGPEPQDGKNAVPLIDLRIMTTNLSMRRPHTLPKLGLPAGFHPSEWAMLFPKPVMDYLMQTGAPWEHEIGAFKFPSERSLPVLVAVRMSMSFPVLFTAVPLRMQDTEYASIMKTLGGVVRTPVRTLYLSDGGLSSNFPIHLFDAPLPKRPTFAFSLERLPDTDTKVARRVFLPIAAGKGLGVQIDTVNTLGGFAMQLINSAKDWQDQLLSEITGQRERIARIFLAGDEGGFNINMDSDVSLALMRYGYEAGCAFTNNGFDFDEHRWRRFLGLSRVLGPYLGAADRAWSEHFAAWLKGHDADFNSYNDLEKKDRATLIRELETMLEAHRNLPLDAITGRDEKLPKKSGVLRITPKT